MGANRNEGTTSFDESAGSFLASHYTVVADVVDYICAKRRLSPDEKEDFRSWVMLKLAEREEYRLRRFQGRGSLRGYLNVAVHRLLLDYRDRQWGRWRTSRKAEALGPEGVWLERYIYRDSLPVTEAVQTVKTNHGSSLSEAELGALASQLPYRDRASRLDIDEIVDILSSGQASPEDVLSEQDEERRREEIAVALERALSTLTDEERVILKMRFEHGFTVQAIARAFHLAPKPFYRRFHRLLGGLRGTLQSQLGGKPLGPLSAELGKRTFSPRTRARGGAAGARP